MHRTDIHEILHPQSIAIVGVSSNPLKGATIFLQALLHVGYEGKLYPINDAGEDSLGMKTYPSLLDVPDTVDHVIVGVSARRVPSEIESAVKKGARSVHIYSAGFDEINTEEGIALKKESIKIALGRVRIMGPNCMGMYNPRMKIAFDPNQFPRAGGAAFISQSGGLAGVFSFTALQEKNYCSKVVSIGNSWDLQLTDFLEYFVEDEETQTISMYIEGIGAGEGRRMMKILDNNKKNKPVLLWKGGQTQEGANAAFSHTGALASNSEIWNAFARQYGVILVDSIEEIHDFLKLYRLVQPPKSKRACLVAFGGGGRNVTCSDICARNELILPPLQKEIQDGLLDLVPPAGTITVNPVDLMAHVVAPTVLEKALRIVSRDPNVDSILFVLDVVSVDKGTSYVGIDPRNIVDIVVSGLVSARDHLKIPIFCCNPIVIEDLKLEELRLYLKEELERHDIPSFLSIDRTIKAVKRYHDYSEFRNSYRNGGKHGDNKMG